MRNPLAVVALAAIAMLVLPFWWAMGVAIACCLYAAWEVALWARAYRQREKVRAFINHELDRMPRREEPTRREVLTVALHYPHAWQPFVDRRAEVATRHAAR